MKTTQKNITIYPRCNGKTAPGILVELNNEAQDPLKEAIKEAKNRSGLARFKSWSFGK